MQKNVDSTRVLIAGTYRLGDAYPNVKYRIETLKKLPGLEITELHFPATTQSNYRSRYSKLMSIAHNAALQLYQSSRCLFAILRCRNYAVLYIPYPAIPVLYLLSYLPGKFRPGRIIIDSFISLYDTTVVDRHLLKPEHILARLLYRVERRALQTATAAITDTPHNSAYLSKLFKLPEHQLCSLPLAINEHCYASQYQTLETESSSVGVFRVLFVGTFVPLHGIDHILTAIRLLKPGKPIEFVFIGDGQQSNLLQQFLDLKLYDTSYITIRWIKQWMESEEVRSHIEQAQLCLGVMGTTDKSKRVWPLKNYIYMATGKALITAKCSESDRLLNLVDYAPFLTVDNRDPQNLADKIQEYLNDSTFPGNLPKHAHRFFEDILSRKATSDTLLQIITGQKTHFDKPESTEFYQATSPRHRSCDDH